MTFSVTRQFGTGSIYPGAATLSSISIGPRHEGSFAAKVWRIWSQGDEFYAGQRDGIPKSKVSFHSTNWHMDLDSRREKLAEPLPLSLPGWSLALQLKFLVFGTPMPSVVKRKVKKSSKLIGVDTPRGSKLVVNLLCAPQDTQLTSNFPPEADGIRMLIMRLRTKGAVAVTTGVHLVDRAESSIIADVIRMRVHTETEKPVTVKPNVEMIVGSVGPAGNMVVVVPLSESSLTFSLAQWPK